MSNLRGRPKGFPKDHPAINYLRFKQFYIYAGLNPEVATTSELLPELVKTLSRHIEAN